MEKQIITFIGSAKFDENGGGYIWGVDENGGHQMIAEVRVYGAIQNMFKYKNSNATDFEKSNKFQDGLGRFIADAINEKINNSKISERIKIEYAIKLLEEMQLISNGYSEEESYHALGNKISELEQEIANLEKEIREN